MAKRKEFNYQELFVFLKSYYEKRKYFVDNFFDLISLKEKYKIKGYIAETLTKNPYLPIDMFCHKKIGTDEETGNDIVEYYVIRIAPVGKIDESFLDLLIYLQYPLTFYLKTKNLNICLAIPYSARNQIKKKGEYAKRGFGILTIKDSTVESLLPPVSFRTRIENDYAKKFKKQQPLASATALFFDRYIHEAGEALIKISPTLFPESYIDKKLAASCCNFQKVPYKKDLIKQISNYLAYLKKDDYSFCTEAYKLLWKNVFSEDYPATLSTFESLLKELYPKYREHFVHQFQNFLLGLLIIDRLDQNNYQLPDGIYESWLLATSFHDFAYPIQKYDDWSVKFLKDSLSIEHCEPLGLKETYVENSFASRIEIFLSEIDSCISCKSNRVEVLNWIRCFLYHQITDEKNHAIISGLTLLGKFKDKYKLTKKVLPASVAICLHDDDIWQTLHGHRNEKVELIKWPKDSKDNLDKLLKAKLLKNLDFSNYSLAFLLLLCDNIQDWGRPFRNEKLNKSCEAANIRFEDIIVSSDNVRVKLLYDDNNESLSFMGHKNTSLELLKNFLKSSDIKFVIEYWNRKKPGNEQDHKYEISI